jgi:hypothetical protein
MNVFSRIVPAVVASLFAGACARPPAAAVAEPAKAPAKDLPTIGLSYEVTRGGDANDVVLSGHTDAEAHRATEVVQHAAKGAEKEELKLRPRPREDGAFLVEMRYAEVTPDGGHIAWEPVVLVKRGAAATADVTGPGWTRSVKVKVE